MFIAYPRVRWRRRVRSHLGRARQAGRRRLPPRGADPILHPLPTRLARDPHHRGPQRDIQGRSPFSGHRQEAQVPEREDHPVPSGREHGLARAPRRRAVGVHGISAERGGDLGGLQDVLLRHCSGHKRGDAQRHGEVRRPRSSLVRN